MSTTQQQQVEPLGEAGGGDPGVGMTLYVGLLGVIITLVVIFAAQTMWYGASRSRARDINATSNTRSAIETQEMEAQLYSSVGWMDRDAGTAHIPLDVAKGMVVKRLREERR